MVRFRTRWFMALVTLLGLVLIGTLGIPQVAQAVEFDEDGIITADEVIDDDVFVSSEVVVVDGIINGNLIASGRSVTINGDVNGDLIMSGVDVTVNGQVNGNVAFVGQSLLMNGRLRGSLFCINNSAVLGPLAVVGRNVFFNGFSLETQSGSMVGRDAIISGIWALLDGRVERDIQVEVGALEIRGIVGRNVMATVPGPDEGILLFGGSRQLGAAKSVESGLRVTKDAYIGGTLAYVSSVEQSDRIEAVPGGGIEYQVDKSVPHPDMQYLASQWFAKRMRDLVTLLVLGGLAVWTHTPLLNRLADRMQRKPLPVIGWGSVVLVGGHTVLVILAVLILVLGILTSVVTLGGLAVTVFGVGFSGLALAGALFWLAIAYGAKLIVAYLVGRLVWQRLVPRYADQVIWPLVMGVVLYVLARSIPVLGWFIGLLVTLAGLGAMWMLYREKKHGSESV
ncbi:MAG: polymer-forming cytoskeletal protein [Chloroflexi bacterium]|nr:polymer-forming cytoskeletal protein [Chloroflexota bacterium]